MIKKTLKKLMPWAACITTDVAIIFVPIYLVRQMQFICNWPLEITLILSSVSLIFTAPVAMLVGYAVLVSLYEN